MKYEKLYLKSIFPRLGENGADPKVEVYLPDPMIDMGWQDKKRPCMVICPGGGYGGISAREGEPIGWKFLEAGYNVFVVTYSVAPHRFPQQLREVAAVMELIYQNANEWSCDVTRVAIMGFSAGGHLAAHYSNMYNSPEVRELFPESKPVQATVLGYPVITSDLVYANTGTFRNLLGYYPEKNEIQFSCEKLVSEHTPPAFLWHTATDELVPVENSMLYAGALSRYKIPFELHIYPFGRHGLATVDGLTCDENWMDERAERAHEWMKSVTTWLDIIW